jgi:hypothetical protein
MVREEVKGRIMCDVDDCLFDKTGLMIDAIFSYALPNQELKRMSLTIERPILRLRPPSLSAAPLSY